MKKTAAYVLGVQRALLDAGLLKQAETDDPSLVSSAPDGDGSNPAELLAAAFQQADQNTSKQAPDNKTKSEHHDPLGRPTQWGKPVSGTGGEGLERNVPGFYLPTVSSI